MIFPDPITSLPRADIPLPGLKAFLSQAPDHQVLFMEFDQDAEVGDHSHEAQWAVVLAGKLDLTIDGVKHTFTKGDSYYIPAGVVHSAKVYAGYADVTFFDQKDRYAAIED